MPAKSRRKKGRFSPQRQPQNAAPRPAAVQPPQTRPVIASSATVARPKTAAPVSQGPATLPIPHTNVVVELRTIAVLAGVLVVVLVVLSFVLR